MIQSNDVSTTHHLEAQRFREAVLKKNNFCGFFDSFYNCFKGKKLLKNYWLCFSTASCVAPANIVRLIELKYSPSPHREATITPKKYLKNRIDALC